LVEKKQGKREPRVPKQGKELRPIEEEKKNIERGKLAYSVGIGGRSQLTSPSEKSGGSSSCGKRFGIMP